MYSQKLFWQNTYSVWTGVVELWKQNELALAGILFFFSIVFPFAKLVGLTVIWFLKLPKEGLTRLLHWLGILGKWSMLDVFVVAILIVLVKLGPLVKVEPRVGIYVFSAAIAASMLTTMYIETLAKRALRLKS
jgi:paraquat-inducible protein A